MPETEGTWTVRRLLEWTSPFFTRKGVDSPRLSAELLLAHVLAIPRIKLYTDYERVLDPQHLSAYRELVRRAAEDEPVAYLTGRAHFFSLEFHVTRDVLIPRPDTETLVENVIQLIRHQPGLESARILDLCTGSGCVAAAIAHNVKGAVVVATDISEKAVAIACENLKGLGLADRVTVEQGDLFAPLDRLADRQPYHLLVANPPYIPTSQIPQLERSVREYEPLAALDGGPDGLAFHRRILAESPGRLVPGSHIFLEIAFDQADAARRLAGEYPGFTDVRILKDHAGHDRVLTARRG
ncbi:MAG TPA: peptide chain release factor N(5)-glutamine methyltransferase [Tepidisphaeraceae bacterium]|jgi:release factor glutamine methyltransferase|nr:peptide chain release factor N(5)-glutamine methyltransferase [Tepidisphaeraceae bacterium]